MRLRLVLVVVLRMAADALFAGTIIVGSFAFGARLVAAGTVARQTAGRSPAITYGLAGLCFLIAAAAVLFGLYLTVQK